MEGFKPWNMGRIAVAGPLSMRVESDRLAVVLVGAVLLLLRSDLDFSWVQPVTEKRSPYID